jgi:hypothetical protein
LRPLAVKKVPATFAWEVPATFGGQLRARSSTPHIFGTQLVFTNSERAMTRSICVLLVSAVLLTAAETSWAQLNIQPTPAPLVTAEGEAWFQAGEPIVSAGGLYYPAGALIHFLPNEMVRTGMFRGVPLYSRTTIEPFSVVFVPISGGLMQPYERRRDFELAGTQGSSAPVISPALSPSVGPTTAASPFGAPSPMMAQAAAPPFIGAPIIFDEPLRPAVSEAAEPSQPPAAAQPVATTGVTPLPIRRGAANGIYVEFNNARWFISGQPVSLDASRLTRVGETDGFPVYTTAPGAATIYVPISQGSDTYARYSRRK